MTTLAEAYKQDLQRTYTRQIDFGVMGNVDANTALFDLNSELLRTLLNKALKELRAQVQSKRVGKSEPEAAAVCHSIIETVVKDIAMALTGKEWEPKE